jgi:hypothetical protein
MRWLGLSFFLVLAGCYAIPAEHNLPSPEPSTGADGGTDDPDAEAEDAEIEGEDASKLDARADAELDAAKDAAREAALDSNVTVDGATRDGATPDAGPCNGACGGDTPVCVEATNTCVRCTASKLGACKANQFCTNLATCVDCQKNEDCTDPAASVCDTSMGKCVACSDGNDAHCTHITDKNVCSGARCVQCTKDKLTACFKQVGAENVQYACNALTRACSANVVRKTKPCGECVSDAECETGNVCVQMTLGETGKYYCAPTTVGNCETKQPFYKYEPSKRTIDAAMSNVCTLAVSSCAAHRDYNSKFCGLDNLGRPVPVNDAGMPQGTATQGDNTACGSPGLDDGYCLQVAPGSYRCTVPCANNKNDCHLDAPLCASRAHATGTRDLCTFP